MKLPRISDTEETENMIMWQVIYRYF